MTENEEDEILSKLIGKRIVRAEFAKISDTFDDEPYLDLELDDGTTFRIVADYGGYTGNSEDEYPRFIRVEPLKTSRET